MARLSAGKAVDITSSPENPQYLSQTATLIDANHIQLDAHTVLKRGGDAEVASFKQAHLASTQKLRKEPFLLDGTWRYEKGYPDIWVRLNEGEVTLLHAAPYEPVFFRGKYMSNPVINGKMWGDGSTLQNTVWVDSTVTIEGPDRLRYGTALFIRISDPPKGDLPCDSGNPNHIDDYHAWRRGAVAMKEQDNKTARCWLEIAADYPRAQSSLAALLILEGDFKRAFELATKSAKNGDTAGEMQLAAMYSEGKGTEPDAAKADYWLQKAQQSKDAAAWKQVGGALSIVELARKAFEVAPSPDLSLGMTPSSTCYGTVILGNKQTAACQH